MSLAAPVVLRRAALLAVLATVLTGCGQTGPLYLPGDEAAGSVAVTADGETDEEAADDERRSP